MQTLDKGQIRIIGGQLRGRKIHFTPEAGLRPTPDRVKETLFNWLAPYIVGARCLDLFAGSGSLGFEALSRGADSVVMLESNPKIKAQIEENAKLIKIEGLRVIGMDALQYLKECEEEFDVIFLDPPFGQGMIGKVIQILNNTQVLHNNSHVYVEVEESKEELPILNNSIIYADKMAGSVRYALLKCGYEN